MVFHRKIRKYLDGRRNLVGSICWWLGAVLCLEGGVCFCIRSEGICLLWKSFGLGLLGVVGIGGRRR